MNFSLKYFFILFMLLLLSCSSTAKEEESKDEGKKDREEKVEEEENKNFTFHCEYKDYPGTITITSIEKDKSGKKDSVVVLFDFTPEESEGSANYRFNNFSDKSVEFKIAGGMNPPISCLNKQGLKQGSKHPAIRKEIRKGTCTPVIFKIKEFKESECFN